MSRFRCYVVAAMAIFAGCTLLSVAPVFADSGDVPVNLTDTAASLRVSALAVNALVSIFIPLLVGLATKWSTKPLVRGLLDLVIGAVSALIVQATVADGSAVLSAETFLVWLVGLGASAVAYMKAWKPAGLTSSPVVVPGPVAGSTMTIPGKLNRR